MMRPQHLTLVFSALLALIESAHAGVIVVDAAGGGDFTQIQPAVNAAAQGDTILVKPGSYAAFTIDAKALTIVGDVGTDVDIAGNLRIRNLAAHHIVTLARLKRETSSRRRSPALRARACS